jgi:hypothetical protein
MRRVEEEVAIPPPFFAYRKLRELLGETELAQRKRTELVSPSNQVDDTPTFSDIGVSKTQSHCCPH